MCVCVTKHVEKLWAPVAFSLSMSVVHWLVYSRDQSHNSTFYHIIVLHLELFSRATILFEFIQSHLKWWLPTWCVLFFVLYFYFLLVKERKHTHTVIFWWLMKWQSTKKYWIEFSPMSIPFRFKCMVFKRTSLICKATRTKKSSHTHNKWKFVILKIVYLVR